MTSIITGDIVNSRGVTNPQAWLSPLKHLLSTFGKAPQTWEIFRGDSFQLEVENPADALNAVLRIKACVKSIRKLDVRMAIGIGANPVRSSAITESQGDAFIRSGEQFDVLKPNKKTLALQSPWPQVDHTLNLMLDLASIAMDAWSPAEAQVMAAVLAHPAWTQMEVGHHLGKKQSTVSETLKRAHAQEIQALDTYFRTAITNPLKQP